MNERSVWQISVKSKMSLVRQHLLHFRSNVRDVSPSEDPYTKHIDTNQIEHIRIYQQFHLGMLVLEHRHRVPGMDVQ